MDPQFRPFAAGADDHMVVIGLFEQFGNVFGSMLSVAIHKDQEPSTSGPDAALNRRAIADIAGMAENIRARPHRDLCAAVRRAVTDNDTVELAALQGANLS